jgi:hypothetical protein
VAEAQEKLPQMEALGANASVPGDSSNLAPNSDLKLTGIRCRRPKEPIVVKEEFVTALKIVKKREPPEESVFRGRKSAIRIFIGLRKEADSDSRTFR